MEYLKAKIEEAIENADDDESISSVLKRNGIRHAIITNRDLICVPVNEPGSTQRSKDIIISTNPGPVPLEEWLGEELILNEDDLHWVDGVE